MDYSLEKVERIPSQLNDNIVYVSDEYELAALNCACGCGHKVTLLMGDGHQVRELNGLPDIFPSIGVWDAPCRSHFHIEQGKVRWAEHVPDDVIQTAMEAQLRRHVEMSHQPWYRRLWKRLASLFRKAD